jgi:mono/diheme cytochrome c family protein
MKLFLKWGVGVALGVATLPAASAAQEMPAGVTAAMVAEGKEIFAGAGLCASCHGPDGTGTPIAPALNDAAWLNIDGAYPNIVTLVTTGVATPKEHPVPMAPKGGTNLSDDQVKAVAAYVWSLTNGM